MVSHKHFLMLKSRSHCKIVQFFGCYLNQHQGKGENKRIQITVDTCFIKKAYKMIIIDKFAMMANLSIINILPNRVADIYIKLKSITSKLHYTSASIAFIKKALFVDVIPKFVMVTLHKK